MFFFLFLLSQSGLKIYFQFINFSKARFLLKCNCRNYGNFKIRHCLMSGCLISGGCLIDEAPARSKSGGSLIDQAAAWSKSGSCLIDQDPGLGEVYNWHVTPDTWHLTPNRTPVLALDVVFSEMFEGAQDPWHLTSDTKHVKSEYDTWYLTLDTWHVKHDT